jgi:signal transduction histidine kinase
MSEILANEQYTLNEKERNNFITEIHNLLKNQFKLVDNLLDWAKIQTGRQPFNPVRINLSEKVNEVNTILNANAINKNIKVTNNVESDVFVFADSYMLQSTLQNLISNAIKFTNTNGTISISSIERDNYFEITVADNGVGISDEEKGKIFRIDTQHSTLGTDHEKGTGLGLIICKEMLEKNGGKIWIESEPGVGSKFIFTLPKCQEK